MVSALGVGCNNFGGRLDQTQSSAVIHAALDLGVTHFDTAAAYPMGAAGRSEEILGVGLGKRRNQAVIATKFGWGSEGPQAGSQQVVKAVEDSLKRLNTDHIDLMYLHKPDPLTPIDETLTALDALIMSGKLRFVASSNFAAWKIVEAQFLARELGLQRFVASQEHYSLLAREIESEVIPASRKYGVGIFPFFPLASGVLSGKYTSGGPAPTGTRLTKPGPLADRFLAEANLAKAHRYGGIAADAGLDLIDLAFAWLLRDPVVPSVIAGASTPEQVARNAKAVAARISDNTIAALQG